MSLCDLIKDSVHFSFVPRPGSRFLPGKSRNRRNERFYRHSTDPSYLRQWNRQRISGKNFRQKMIFFPKNSITGTYS
jgi:hypothetical protein